MAITLDANLGTGKANGPAFPWSGYSTSATAAAGTGIILQVSWWSNLAETLSSVTGGGLTWTIDYQHANASNDRFAIVSAPAPTGLASSTALTLNFAGSTPLEGGVLVGAASFFGLKYATATTLSFDTSATNDTSGTSFATGSASNSQGSSLFIGGTGFETATTSSATWTGPAIELHDDWLAVALQGISTAYLIVTDSASRSLAGTVSPTSTASTTGLAIYRAAPDGLLRSFNAIPFM